MRMSRGEAALLVRQFRSETDSRSASPRRMARWLSGRPDHPAHRRFFNDTSDLVVVEARLRHATSALRTVVVPR
jgi:hypothetical protein